jgi:hypothetical protein
LQDAAATGHGVAGFLNNAHTAVTRRFKNILTDERTHAIFERFLGLSVSAGAVAGGGPGTPKSNGRPGGQKYEADAQALPTCDDEDSESDEDPLSDKRWPAGGLSPTHAPLELRTGPIPSASGTVSSALSPSTRGGSSADAVVAVCSDALVTGNAAMLDQEAGLPQADIGTGEQPDALRANGMEACCSEKTAGNIKEPAEQDLLADAGAGWPSSTACKPPGSSSTEADDSLLYAGAQKEGALNVSAGGGAAVGILLDESAVVLADAQCLEEPSQVASGDVKATSGQEDGQHDLLSGAQEVLAESNAGQWEVQSCASGVAAVGAAVVRCRLQSDGVAVSESATKQRDALSTSGKFISSATKGQRGDADALAVEDVLGSEDQGIHLKDPFANVQGAAEGCEASDLAAVEQVDTISKATERLVPSSAALQNAHLPQLSLL